MASTYTPLGIEKQATGENAGTWGTKTNTNLEIVEQISGGYAAQAVSDSGDTTLSVSDGSTGATLAHRVIEFTGSLTASRNVTIPLDVQNFYFLKNATSGSQNVVFKYVTGTGTSATVANGKTVIAYAKADDGTNPNISTISLASDLVDDTTPQLGGNLDTNSFMIDFDDAHGIRDENGNEQIIFQTTGSAVNQFDITNAATGNAPEISSTGGDTNIDLKITPKGSGKVVLDGNVSIDTGVIDLKNGGTASKVLFYCESSNAHAQTLQSAPHSVGATNTLTLPGGTTIGNSAATLVADIGTQTLTNKNLTSPKIGTSILDTNGNELFKLTATGSAVNELTYANAATGNKPSFTATGGDTNIGVSIQPKGSGTVTIDALTFPAADGSADQVLKTDGSGTLSFTDVSGGTSWQAVKTSGFTAVAGEGYFINTTSGAIEMDLPAGSIGDEVSFIDYAGTFDSNALTVDPNGSEKIAGSTDSLTVSVERAANTLVYVDGTQGWLLKNN